MKLRKGQLCPIHRSRNCCGRYLVQGRPLKNPSYNGVTRVPDPNHPRGYREKRSPAAMRELLARKVKEQNGNCALCHEPFTDFREAIPEHIEPKGMGGARRDDHPDNIQAAHHYPCNVKKGSQRENSRKAS